QVEHGVAIVRGKGHFEPRQPLGQGGRVDLVSLRLGAPGDGDRVVPVGEPVAAVVQERLALEDQVDLDDAGVLGPGLSAGLVVRGPAPRPGLVDRAGGIPQGGGPAVRPPGASDELLLPLLANHRGEQRLLGEIRPLVDAGPVPVHQSGQKDLVQARDKLVLEGGPELLVFQVGVHSGEGGRHGARLPRWLARSGAPRGRVSSSVPDGRRILPARASSCLGGWFYGRRAPACAFNPSTIVAALRSLPNPASTVARPATPNFSARTGSVSTSARASARASGFPGGTRRPFSPSRTSSAVPPAAVVTTGTVMAMASSITPPSGPDSRARANTWADSSAPRTASSAIAPGSLTASPSPSSDTMASRSRRYWPVPESASSPATTSRASSPRARNRPTARIRT